MQIVIDIPEKIYADACEYVHFDRNSNWGGVLSRAIRNSAPLPEGHGRLVDIDEFIKNHTCTNYYGDPYIYFENSVESLINETPTIIKADVH